MHENTHTNRKGGEKMKAEEKVIHYIRKGLEEKHGEEYVMLSHEQQDDLVWMVIREHIEQMRKEKRHR